MKKQLEKFQIQLAACSACGLCNAVCPVFGIKGSEGDGPRGRVALALALARRQITPGEAIRGFTSCLFYGRCEGACSVHLPLISIFAAVRNELARHLPSSA